MKKVIALALVFIMVFSFAACGKKDRNNTVSGQVVDNNTIEIVDNAYKTTEDLLKSIKALDVQSNIVKITTADGESLSERVTSKISFINSDTGKSYALGTVIKSGDVSDEMQMYCDGKNTYGARAGKTYILSKNKDTDAYVDGVFAGIKVGKVADVTVVNTTIVNTSTGGHGFVLEYDCSNIDAEKLFGTYFTEKKAGFDVKFTKLTASGIVDSEGRLTAQTISLEYTYDVKISTSSEGTSSESTSSNATSSNKTSSKQTTSSEDASSVVTEEVKKTVSAKLSIDNTFKYDIDTVKVPDLVVIGKDEDGNDIKHDEISIQDFTGLAAGSSESADKKR